MGGAGDNTPPRPNPLNFTSAIAFGMGKTYNGTKIQKEVYYTLREKFRLRHRWLAMFLAK